MATREMERKIIGTGLAYRTAVNVNDQCATVVCDRLARAALSSVYIAAHCKSTNIDTFARVRVFCEIQLPRPLLEPRRGEGKDAPRPMTV